MSDPLHVPSTSSLHAGAQADIPSTYSCLQLGTTELEVIWGQAAKIYLRAEAFAWEAVHRLEGRIVGGTGFHLFFGYPSVVALCLAAQVFDNRRQTPDIHIMRLLF